MKPASSSASRMAPTRPSIMSLGATTSAPARAWQTACWQRTATVSSFRMRAVFGDDAVVAVARVGIERDVGDHDQLREFRLESRHESRDEPLGIVALPPPSCSWRTRRWPGKRTTAPIPSS